MSTFRLGMGYSDVARRIKRIQFNPGHPQAKANIINSLKNQCRLAEGNSALKELERECASSANRSSSLTGAGARQVGCCMKFDCIYRDDKLSAIDICNSCIRGSAYSPKTLEGSALIH